MGILGQAPFPAANITANDVVYHHLTNFHHILKALRKSQWPPIEESTDEIIEDFEESFLITGIYLIRTKPKALEWPDNAGMANATISSNNHTATREELDGYILAKQSRMVGLVEENGWLIFFLWGQSFPSTNYVPNSRKWYDEDKFYW